MSDERGNPLWQTAEEARNEWRDAVDRRAANGTMNDYIVRAILAAGWRRSPAPVDGHEAGWQAGIDAAAQRCRDAGGYGPAFADAISAVPYSGAAQPADAAVIERARWYLGLTDLQVLQYDTAVIAEELAQGCLAEHARAEALQAAGFAYRDQMRAEVSRATAAEAALAEARAEIERLKEALTDIGQSGPVNDKGEPDPYAGWSWCYERARAALEAADGR